MEGSEQKNNSGLRWLCLALILISIIFLIACFVSNGFINPATAFFNLDIQPADFCFYTIWPIIYIFQVAFLIYGLSYLFRRDPDKVLLISKINHIHFIFYIFAIICYMADITWSWSNASPIANFVTITVMAFTQWAIVFASMGFLQKYLEKMKDDNMGLDVVLTRLIIQNGCAIFATWTTLAMFAAFANLITNTASVDGIVMSTVALSIIIAFLLVYFLIDIVIFSNYFLFEYTPYLVVMWNFIGILAKQINSRRGLTRNNIFSIVILCLATVMLLIKMILQLCIWEFIKPVATPSTQPNNGSKRFFNKKKKNKTPPQPRPEVQPEPEPEVGVWHY